MKKSTKKTIWIIILVTITCTIVYLIVTKFVGTPPGWKASLINPSGNISGSQPELTPTPTPRQFQFNKDTDLKSELESVDPKAEDNDFSSLKHLTRDP